MLFTQNKDLKGNVIEQRAKDSHSTEIDGTSKFCGHRFLLKTKLYGDKKCLYCGKWYHWSDRDYFTWIREKNIDSMNNDGALEPLHCGSEHCQEYHRRWLIHQEKKTKIDEQIKAESFFSLFKRLKKQGVIK